LVVVGSTKTQSDEEDYLAELTHQTAHSALEDDFKRNDPPCSTEKTKVLLPLCFFFKVGRPALVSVIMFSGSDVRVLGFLPDLQGWVLSGSSPSTLCVVGCKCSCRQGSSRGSLNVNGSSPLATWDLLYEVAGEVERTIGFEPV